MNLVSVLREYYASSMDNKVRGIVGLLDEYPAYVYKHGQDYGVCIPFNSPIVFSEDFTNAKLRTLELYFNGGKEKVLFLSTSNSLYREQFSIISANFIDPGVNGERRKSIVDDPEKWVLSWVDLLGNTKKNKKSYSIFGELYVLYYLFKKDKTIRWTGASSGTHDIESNDSSFEVKTTKLKYDNYITVSSHNQLFSNNSTQLVFVRLEQTPYGISINSLVENLVAEGYDKENLESGLSKHGLYSTKRERNIKYTVLESKKYNLDKDFPKLNLVDLSTIPKYEHIVKITYSIDLTGLDYIQLID